MTPDTAALRALADTATPGPYNVATAPHEGEDKAGYLTGTLDPDSDAPLWLTWAETDREGLAYIVPFLTGDGPRSEANARYIAALNPDTVRALCDAADEVERLRRARLCEVHYDDPSAGQARDDDSCALCVMCQRDASRTAHAALIADLGARLARAAPWEVDLAAAIAALLDRHAPTTGATP